MTIKTDNVQIGQNATATQNFTVTQGADGSGKIARGNVGATTQDIITWDAAGNVNLPVSVLQGGIATQRMVLSTAQATTSGTSFNYAVPSWAKKITAVFSRISGTGGANHQIQLGTGGVATTSGYISTDSTAGYTTSFQWGVTGAAYTYSGSMTFIKISGNTWVMSGAVGDQGSISRALGGDVTLAGVCDFIKLSNTGADTYDNGIFNVLFEG